MTDYSVMVKAKYLDGLIGIIQELAPLVSDIAELERHKGSVAVGYLIDETGYLVQRWAMDHSMRAIDEAIKTVGAID